MKKNRKATAGSIAAIGLFLAAFHGSGVGGCGGGASGDVPPTSGPDLSQGTSFTISSKGGEVEIKDAVKINFPSDTFPSDVTLSIQEGKREETLDVYSVSSTLFNAGNSVGKFLQITSPVKPQKNAVLRYQVPQEFTNSLGKDYKPRLFVQIYQVGANEEHLDYFEPLDSELKDNLLTTTLPKEAFTDFRSEKQGEYEAIVMIGSSLATRGAKAKTLSDGTQTTLESAIDQKCQASIGSPLERKLEVTSPFGDRSVHKGIDYKADNGDKVLAADDGTITRVGFDERPTPNRFGEKKKGYGRYVILTHSDGSQSVYAHLIRESTDHLKVGDQVKKGTLVGKADTTGGATGPHLHFEYIPVDGKQVDPQPCINVRKEEYKFNLTQVKSYRCRKTIPPEPPVPCVETTDAYTYRVTIPLFLDTSVALKSGTTKKIDMNDLIVSNEIVSARYDMYIEIKGPADTSLDTYWAQFNGDIEIPSTFVSTMVCKNERMSNGAAFSIGFMLKNVDGKTVLTGYSGKEATTPGCARRTISQP